MMKEPMQNSDWKLYVNPCIKKRLVTLFLKACNVGPRYAALERRVDVVQGVVTCVVVGHCHTLPDAAAAVTHNHG